MIWKRLENYSLNAVKITGKIYKLIRIVTIRINNSEKTWEGVT